MSADNPLMRILAATDMCTAAGNCTLAAPNVFDQSDQNGTIVVLDSTPPESERGNVLDAIQRCPASVISLAES